MESYVIRIYRQEKMVKGGRRQHDAITLNGVVVHPESGERVSFNDIDSLWKLLVKDDNVVIDSDQE